MTSVVKPRLFNPSPIVNGNKYRYSLQPTLPFVEQNPIINQKPRLFEDKMSILPVLPIELHLKMAASGFNASVSLLKGITSFGEALIDTAAIIAGGVATPLFINQDLANLFLSAVKGEKWEGFTYTKSLWTNKIMPAVGENLTEELFDFIYYDREYGKVIDDLAFDCCKKDGVVCKITEGIGYYTGVVALSAATAGAGLTTIMPTSVAHGVVAGTAAIGRNTQERYNNLSDEEKQDMGSIAKTVGVSTAMGIVEGGTYAAGVELGNIAGSAVGNVSNAMVETVTKTVVQGTIKSARPVINEGIQSIADHDDYDFKKVGIEVASVYGSEIVGAVVETGVTNKFGTIGVQKAQQIANQFNGPNGNVGSYIESAAPMTAREFSKAAQKHITYAATEWSEGVAQSVVEQPIIDVGEAA